VLDPVGCGATAYRTQVAADLAGLAPSVIRSNASEILSLAGQVGAAGKGVDSSARAEDATGAAALLAQRAGCVVAVTGATDYVSDGGKLHGDPCRGCADAAVDRARVLAQRRYRRLRRRLSAA